MCLRIILVLLAFCGLTLMVNAQHYGAWRVAYSDSAMLAETLPVLMNPLPLQGDYRVESAPWWFLSGSGNRMYLDSYDHCSWKTPNEVEIFLHSWWDLVGAHPMARYVFDGSGRLIEYGYYGQRYDNPDFLVIQRKEKYQYNDAGQLAYMELISYRAHTDSFSTR